MDEDNSHIKEIKQNSIDSLSKEELASKCKNFIALLKKAKTSKDELVAELEKEKISKTKLMKSFENAQNHSDKELEALRDVVTNLTDNKIDLVTKNESLQRQLQLQLSEVESLKNAENFLREDCKAQRLEIERVQKLVEQQAKLIEGVKEEKNMLKQENTLWYEEKFQLMDKIQALEEQISQTDQLKGKIKLLVEESSKKELGLSQENKELRGQARRMEEECKAMEIVQNEMDLKLKKLQENLINAKDEIKSLLEDKERIAKDLNDKLLVDETLQNCRHELELVKAEKLKIEDKVNCHQSDTLVDSSHEIQFEELSSNNILKAQQIETLLSKIQFLEQELEQLKLAVKQSSQIISEYEFFKKETVNLICLTNKLLNLEDNSFSDDILRASKSTYTQLENIIKSFSCADLKASCDKFSSDIKQFGKELSIIIDSPEKFESECLIVDPVIAIFSNLGEVFLNMDKVFKFNLASDFISNIDYGKSEAKKFGKLLVNLSNDKQSNLDVINRFQVEIEDGKNVQFELNEKKKKKKN